MAIVHKNIRVPFEIGNRRYEAVGFLNKGESSVSGYTMLARTVAKNGGAIGNEDVAFLKDLMDLLPKEFYRYCLVTNQRSPDYPCYISCYYYESHSSWNRFWRLSSLRCHQWSDRHLVVRRRA